MQIARQGNVDVIRRPVFEPIILGKAVAVCTSKRVPGFHEVSL